MKNCISRRSFLKAAGMLGAAGALAACGGSSSSTTAASSTASLLLLAQPATGASIKLWTYPIGGWGNDDTVQNLISSFNAKYPDIKVTVEYLDYTNGDDQVNTAIEGGSAPDLVMEGPERLVANWGAKGVMAPLNDLWTDDAKKDIYESVESACHNDKGDYYEYPLCMTAHCMAVNMTKVKEVGADKYIDTDKHTWSTEGFLNTVDALYKRRLRERGSHLLQRPGRRPGHPCHHQQYVRRHLYRCSSHQVHRRLCREHQGHPGSVRCKGRQLRPLHQRRRGDHPVPQRHPADGFLLEHRSAAER